MFNATPLARAQSVCAVIEQARIQIATETQAQKDVFDALVASGIQAEREYKLDERSRLDVLAFDDIAVEVKIQGGRRAIWKQVERYAGYDKISAVVLATSVAFAFQASDITKKPVLVASLSRGWM
jgi:hypothetical protein